MQTLALEVGREASKHFIRLNASKVILAVRSIKKAEAAKAEIEAQTKRTAIVEVYRLDYPSYASVKAFAARVAEPERLDIAVLNISVATEQFEISENNENTLTVNFISIALLLFPILRSTAEKYNIEPVITIVGSERKKHPNHSPRSTTERQPT